MSSNKCSPQLANRVQATARPPETSIPTATMRPENEAQYRGILENCGALVWQIDLEDRLVFLNERARDGTGLSAANPHYRRLASCFHPDDRACWRQIEAQVRTGQIVSHKIRLRNRHGEYLGLEVQSAPVYRDGRVDGILNFGHDITARLQAEQALRIGEEHLRSLMESTSNFVFYRLVGDNENPHKLKVVFISSSAKEILGISDPMKFETWYENMHPDDVERIARANRKAFETMRFDEEYRIFHKTKGDWRWIHAVSTGGRNAADWNQYVNGIMIDISERKRYQLEMEKKEHELQQRHRELETTRGGLAESERHIQSLLDSAIGFAIYRLAFDKDSPYKLTPNFVSPSIKEILGVEPQEFTSDTFFDHIHPDDFPRVKQANDEAFETNRFDQICRFYHALKQRWVWIHAISTGVRNNQNQVTHVNGLLVDITDEQEAVERLKAHEQELLHKTADLREMNAALNVLLKKRAGDEVQFQEKIAANLNQLILPYLNKMGRARLDPGQKALLEIVRSNLDEITAPFSFRLSSVHFGLTPTEIKVADLVRQGLKSKELADLLGLSFKTVESHREKIRKKLGISNTKVNLRSHLLSLE